MTRSTTRLITLASAAFLTSLALTGTAAADPYTFTVPGACTTAAGTTFDASITIAGLHDTELAITDTDSGAHYAFVAFAIVQDGEVESGGALNAASGVDGSALGDQTATCTASNASGDWFIASGILTPTTPAP